MAIKNLLLCYSGSKSADVALTSALFMRDKYDAHLTGLLAQNFAPINPSVGSWISDELRQGIRKAQKQAAKAIEDRFWQQVNEHTNGKNIHWISQRGDSNAVVARYSRFFDLTIVSRTDVAVSDEEQHLHPDKLAMVSGRPVMLIPSQFDMADFREHAMLAWDGKRASTRALSDAMQILRTKSLVTVLTVDDGQSEALLPEINIEVHLQRHGINAEQVVIKQKGKSVSSRILEHIEKTKPKLLVMGAYEHSKFRETIVGGVTRNVLRKAQIPVLISH